MQKGAGARDAEPPHARGGTRRARPFSKNALNLKFFEKCIFFENFANFWRARSRLYQNEILQQNMRLTAFFKLYKICILLHRCNLKFSQKIGLKNCEFRKIPEHFRKFSINFGKFYYFFEKNVILE